MEGWEVMARDKRFDGNDGHYQILQAVREALEAKRYGYCWPKSLKDLIGCTRSEVALALWYLRTQKIAGCRQDGRWYYDDDELWKRSN